MGSQLPNKFLSDVKFSKAIILSEQSSTPATPESGKQKIYPKSDGLWYVLDDNGSEKAITGEGVSDTFDNSDLVSGILTVTHSYGLWYPSAISIYDNNSKLISPPADDITISNNTVTVDLSSFGTITGTWRYNFGNATSNGVGSSTPVGTIIKYAGTTNNIPDGYLIADGSEISRNTYSDLFSITGIRFGDGDGSTTFEILDDPYVTGDFIALGQTSRNWLGMTILGSDVYACVDGGDIYKQTGGTGDFIALGQASRNWRYMTTLGSDVYACVEGGDIYKQTGGTGDFIALGQASRNWVGMTTLGSDVYASVFGGDIYKQTGGTGDFIALGQASRIWTGMTTLGSDVYASVFGGDIYKQTGGTGDFIALGQTSRNWRDMTTLGSDVYASVREDHIYKQTGGTGDFIALEQASRDWAGMTTLGSDVYVSVYGGDIYRQIGIINILKY